MKNTLLRRAFVVALAIAISSLATSARRGSMRAQTRRMRSGEPLRVVANDGVGLLAAPNAYKTIPIGCAHASGSRRPDVFVNATRGIECALYLYPWLRDNERGQPIFAPPVKIDHPFGRASTPNGTIYEDHEGVIRGVWIDDMVLVHCVFDQPASSFRKTGELLD